MKVCQLKVCAAAFVSAFLTVGCDGMKYRQEQRMRNFTITADDFNAIAETTFTLIDPQGKIGTIVFQPSLDPRAIVALKRVRPVVPYIEASTASTEILHAGYFLVRSFSIGTVEGEPEAMIEGQLGPVTRTMTAANLPDCGQIYSVAFVLKGGEWFSPSFKIETCAESRHWVPIDADQSEPHSRPHPPVSSTFAGPQRLAK